jgi:Mn-containing catalase
MGYENVHPIPNSFPQEKEAQEYNYSFMSTWRDEEKEVPDERWTTGPSVDGKGAFSTTRQPGGGEPNLSPAKPHSGAQTEQMDESKLSEAIDKAKETFS